jgi:uncharacterized protein (TIGR03435 family)
MRTVGFARSGKLVRAGRRWIGIVVGAGAVGFFFGAIGAESPAQAQVAGAVPRFEVASVKPSADRSATSRITGGPGTGDPGRLVCSNTPLRFLIGFSYGLKSTELEGPPSITENRYDIVAKVPAGATRDQFLLMVQELLKDRLGVVLHKETRQAPVYELVAAKGGPKLKKAATSVDGSSATTAPDTRKLPKDKDGFPIMPPGVRCFIGFPEGSAIRYVARMQPISGNFLSLLEHSVDRPVVDKTGLIGAYDFNLFVSRGPVNGSGSVAASGSQAPGPGAVEIGDEQLAPDLFAALEHQLGLRLQSAKGPVAVVVVDSFNKAPTAN